MKKTLFALVVLVIIASLLCSCESSKTSSYSNNSNYNSKYNNSSSYGSSNSYGDTNNAKNINNNGTYKQGVLTEKGFYSEWLNLRFVVPSYMKMLDLKTIKNYNESKNGDEIIEMLAVYNNSEESPSIQVTVTKNKENKTAKQAADSYKKSLEEALYASSKNGLSFKTIWDSTNEYEFLGEHYFLYKLTCYIYVNSSLNRTSVGWTMFRIKDDRIISIQCDISGNQYGKYSIESILNLLEPYSS